MIITTTHSIEGKKIVKYLGIANGEVISGADFVKDVMASFRDFFGGRSGAYESELSKAREAALQEMAERAKRMGANAVVGVDLDYETLRQGMLMVMASGTAVLVEEV